MVMNSEEFFRNTTAILKQVFQFLGLSPLPEESLIPTEVYNQGRYADIPLHQQVTNDDRSRLKMVYEPFNKALFELLGWTHGDVEWT